MPEGSSCVEDSDVDSGDVVSSEVAKAVVVVDCSVGASVVDAAAGRDATIPISLLRSLMKPLNPSYK